MASALQLDTDEALTGPSDADPLDSGYIPPDRPYGVDDNAVTAAGEREGESLDERIRQETPDAEPGLDGSRSGRLVSDTAGPGGDAGPHAVPLCAVLIETAAGLDAARDIAAVDGVDGVRRDGQQRLAGDRGAHLDLAGRGRSS